MKLFLKNMNTGCFIYNNRITYLSLKKVTETLGSKSVILQENYLLPPDLIIHLIKEDFYKFAGIRHSKDDVTLLAVKRNASASDTFSLEYNSFLQVLKNVEQDLTGFLKKYVPMKMDSLLSVLQRMVSNALEHGNKLDVAKKVIIAGEVTDYYLKISIENKDNGFNWWEKLYRTLDIKNHPGDGSMEMVVTNQNIDYIYYTKQGKKVILLMVKGG